MNSMRNLEKLGILVIVILVVVVGVVAITPGEQLDKALDLQAKGDDDGAQRREVVPPADEPGPKPAPDIDDLPVWPDGDDESDGLAGTDGRGAVADLGNQPRIGSTPHDVVTPVTPQPEPAPAPAPAAPRSYVVQKGDSYYRIAERVLGHPRHAKALMAANPGVSPTALKPGQELTLPTLDAAGTAPKTETRASAAAETQPRERTEPTGPGGTYVVRKGDSLYEIARAQLGSGERWVEIARLNADVLGNSTRLVPGTKLRLPGSRGGDDGVTASLDPAASGTSSSAPGGVYVVQSQDTLSSIASSKLGSASRWKEIVKLNDDVLHGSDVIRKGMKLKLPAR